MSWRQMVARLGGKFDEALTGLRDCQYAPTMPQLLDAVRRLRPWNPQAELRRLAL
jgi:hypothetical protein